MDGSKPCDIVFQLYKKVLDMHIATKDTDEQFHKASEAIYVALFEAYHKTMEGMTDAGIKPGMDGKTARKGTYEAVQEAKMILERLVDTNKDIAVDNILRGLIEDIGFQLGTARSLLAGKKVEGEQPAEGKAELASQGELAKEEFIATMGVEK